MKILCIDDEKNIRYILSEIFKNSKHEVHVLNVSAGLELYQHSLLDELPFHIVFLDIKMPERDGFDALKLMRMFDELKYGIYYSKIIMLSNINDNDSVLEAFKKQCDEFMKKPIDKDIILNKVNEIENLFMDSTDLKNK